MKRSLTKEVRDSLIQSQKNEITEYNIYRKLADKIKDENNSRMLQQIANDEKEHYDFWKQYTGTDLRPNRWKIIKFYWLSRILGVTFSIKLLEKGEEEAQVSYNKIADEIPEAKKIVDDEDEHEDKLIDMIEEERLKYLGSVVLGLNDALVELTGTLAGLTFALQHTVLIALAGLITGVSASFSMGASEYLSTKSEDSEQNALKSSIYTGVTYILTVIFLILPYFLLDSYLGALVTTIFVAILVIAIFNYYISVARDLNFKTRFLEMASISLGVALFSFLIGYLIRLFLGVEI